DRRFPFRSPCAQGHQGGSTLSPLKVCALGLATGAAAGAWVGSETAVGCAVGSGLVVAVGASTGTAGGSGVLGGAVVGVALGCGIAVGLVVGVAAGTTCAAAIPGVLVATGRGVFVATRPTACPAPRTPARTNEATQQSTNSPIARDAAFPSSDFRA